MGFFDLFRKKPAVTPAPGVKPATPCSAKIASFEPVDAVGTLLLSDGSSVRFGRSACRGFEPVVEAAVVVQAVSEHPLGGWRATEIVLDPQVATYDSLIARRDAALGIGREGEDPVAQAAATSQVLGWIIVLLDETPPSGPQALAQWAAGLGLEKDGVRFSSDGEVKFKAGRHDAIGYVGSGPFPRAALSAMGAREELDPGLGFVGLSLGLPTSVPLMRAVGGATDAWAENGALRDLSRIARALARRGRTVVLPQAGAVMPAETFVARLGDLDDLQSRPFGAWVSWAFDPGRGMYSTFGMGLHGLPDVETAADGDDNWSLDRANEAILLACHRMVFSDSPLNEGAELSVPVGISVGSRAIPAPAVGDSERYVVRAAEGAGLLLEHAGPVEGARAGWRSGELSPVTYREAFLTAFSKFASAWYETQLTVPDREGVPPFEVDVLGRKAGDGFVLVTNGIGRVRQPGGSASARCENVEIVAAMGDHHPMIASVIATVGAQVHAQGGENPFKAGDTVGFAVEELNCAGFVLRAAGDVMIVAGGPPVSLLELVPLTAAEYANVRMGSAPFLSGLPVMTPQSRAARWRLRLN